MLSLLAAVLLVSAPDAPKERGFAGPLGVRLAVKMVAPYDQATPLQIVCVFEHKPAGDTYVDSMKTLDEKLGGALSKVRNSGDFAGALGETLLIDTPPKTIGAARLLVIGLGDEAKLTLETLRVVGRIALREAVRLGVTEVTFAPTIRDQGNTTIDVAAGDRVVMQEVFATYAAEKRLQEQKLARPYVLKSWTLEAGPKFFDNVAAMLTELTAGGAK